MPRVAVVVPCFNDGSTLHETLDSLEGQEPHELVVVDDGSTDPETLRVFEQLEERGVRVARRANGGLSAARFAAVTERWLISSRSPFFTRLVPDATGPFVALGRRGRLTSGNDRRGCLGKDPI